MSKQPSEWIEIRRDYEYTSANEKQLKKVTEERTKPAGMDRKERIDLFFRLITAVAIGVPIFLFYLNQKREIASRKAAQQSEVYAALAGALATLERRPVISAAFRNAKDTLYNALSPKVEILFDENIYKEIEDLNNDIKAYAWVKFHCDIVPKLYDAENDLGVFLKDREIENINTVKNCKEQENELKTMFDLKEDMFYDNDSITDNNFYKQRPDFSDYESEMTKLTKTFSDKRKQLIAFHNAYYNNCDTAMKLIKNGHKPSQSAIENAPQYFNEINKSWTSLGMTPQKSDFVITFTSLGNNAHTILQESFKKIKLHIRQQYHSL